MKLNEDPIRVLHIFGRMMRGGAEMRTIDILQHLDRRRYLLEFCALSGLEGLLDKDIINLGSKVHYCRLDMLFPKRFRRLLIDGQFSVVHSHVHYFSGYILRLAFQVGVPVRVAHFRSTRDDHGDNLRRKLQRRLMRFWIDKHATHILAVSEGAMRYAWSDRWEEDSRCNIIYSGLDTTSFKQKEDRESVCREFGLGLDCHLIIHVGRFDSSKNHHRIVEIFSVLLRNSPKSRLFLIGRGENEIEWSVRQKVGNLGISEFVIFAGERKDIARLLVASDLMLFPSVREGLPGAVLEACAAGTPVLASNLSGIREIAERLPGVTTLPLECNDKTWSDIALNILSIRNIDERRQMLIASFSSSVFNLRDCVMAHCRVWQGQDPWVREM